MTPRLPNKPIFTPRELAYVLHVSTNSVYEWIAAGSLAADGRPMQIQLKLSEILYPALFHRKSLWWRRG